VLPRVLRFAGHSFLPRGLGPGAVALDAGANLGAFALPLQRRCGCRVVCVEPVPALADALAAQGLAVERVALAAADGEAALTLYRGTCASLQPLARDDRVATLAVPAMTLATLLRRLELQQIALLKLDIEGPESALLLTAPAELLQAVGQITVEFHDFLEPALAPQVDAAIARLAGLGFAVFRFSRDRSDLLFVNRTQQPLGPLARFYLRHPYRLLRGALRNLARRLPALRRRTGWDERAY